jgi:uncharacterized protein (DUF433 family)
MAQAQPDSFPRIVRNPRVHGGEPVVRGTRVPVRAVVVAWREYVDLDELLAAYPRLTAEDIEQALSYYDAHREEMDRLIEAQLAGRPTGPCVFDTAIASEHVLSRDWDRPEEDAAWSDL